MFSTSSDKKLQGYRGNQISMYTLSFSARCFWSIMRSLSILGAEKLSTDITQRKNSRAMEETEMHAPETVPQLQSLGTAWQKSMDRSPFLKLENIDNNNNPHVSASINQQPQQLQGLDCFLEQQMSKEKKKNRNFNLPVSEDLLNQNEKNKCFEKFESYKALGSVMLSKNQLRKVLFELGKQASEEELLEMIYEADPNGHGFISFQAFEKIVVSYKQLKEDNISSPIGLTYDEILRAYQLNNPNINAFAVPWSYIQLYLQENFGLKVNLKNFKNFHSKTELTRDEFKYIFA